MAIKYNPYGWEIRPLKDDLCQTIEEEFEIVRLEKEIRVLLEEAKSILEDLFQHDVDPILVRMVLEQIFEKIQKLTEELVVKNLKLYGTRSYDFVVNPNL